MALAFALEATLDPVAASNESEGQIAGIELFAIHQLGPEGLLCRRIIWLNPAIDSLLGLDLFGVQAFEHWFLGDKVLISGHGESSYGHQRREKTANVGKPVEKVELCPWRERAHLAQKDAVGDVWVDFSATLRFLNLLYILIEEEICDEFAILLSQEEAVIDFVTVPLKLYRLRDRSRFIKLLI